jgi:hypothetical protein
VAAYRAAGNPNPASIPAALNLGLLEGRAAAEELFSLPVLDRSLIVAVWRLLRSEAERSLLQRNFLTFSGTITEDRDHDGIIESRMYYRDGMIREYRRDQDQDGLDDVIVRYVRGLPLEADVALAGEPGMIEIMPLDSETQTWALIRWERYPAVLYAELGEKRYIPRPLDYVYAPVVQDDSGLIPEWRDPLPVLTERSLLSFAVILEQPSAEFSGGTERIELSGGLPVRSSVTVAGRTVSTTEYRLGRPYIQYIDIDLDGRQETVRRYDPNQAYRLILSESDWDGDGIFEYAETPQSDGTIKKSWDLNRDGIRETER